MNIFAKIPTLVAMTLLTATTVSAATPNIGLPKQISNSYTKEVDPAISDEFNSKKLDASKWGRRNTGGIYIEKYVNDKSLVKMGSDADGTSYVSMIGTASDGKIRTGGIVSKSTGHFGFYVVRFRFEGLNSEGVTKNKTIWHPSVWGASRSNIAESDMVVANNGNWLELDFMEWYTPSNGWAAHTVARFVDKNGKSRMVSSKDNEKARMTEAQIEEYSEWATIGLEYTPDYLKMWRWVDGKWSEMEGNVVRFVDIDPSNPAASYTLTTIGRDSATPTFWIIGNVVSRFLYAKIKDGSVVHTMEDMRADFDMFRYYPHKSVENKHWSWRGGKK